MIHIKHLEKSYGKLRALQGIDLVFSSSKVTGVIGPNGCGKTTLIKSILGLVIPDKGEIIVSGKTTKGDYTYRSLIGYMPQNPQFPGHLTSRELLDMVEDIQGKKGSRRQELIDLFDIQSHLDKPMGELSGGTRQKTSVVLAFMFDPSILILDEPTVGLDPVAVVRLKQLIASTAKRGRAVILVTHMLAEIEQLVEEMYFLLDGKIKFSGKLDEIRKRAGLDSLEDSVVKLMSVNYQAETAPAAGAVTGAQS